MDNLTKMQRLLPHVAELPQDDSTAAFWAAVSAGREQAAAFALLPLFTGQHRHRAYGMLSALTGRRTIENTRTPFPEVCRMLMAELDEDMLLFCFLVSACGARTVARVLYQYRPPCAAAIAELIRIDRDNLNISLYVCDMLRSILGMFSEEARELPFIREILDHEQDSRQTPKNKASAFIDKMINTFRKEEPSTHEQQA